MFWELGFRLFVDFFSQLSEFSRLHTAYPTRIPSQPDRARTGDRRTFFFLFGHLTTGKHGSTLFLGGGVILSDGPSFVVPRKNRCLRRSDGPTDVAVMSSNIITRCHDHTTLPYAFDC
jgi:hypothetical protein